MIETLRDPAWQFVGVVLALLALGAAFWIYWLQKQAKELAFGLVSSARPLAIADELSARVTVQLDGKPVGNLHLLVYAFKNSGHRAIVPSDFEKPLSIQFPNGKVVSAEVSSKHPANLETKLTASASHIELAPLLLNPGDQVLLKVLLSEQAPTWTLDVRIVDVSEVVQINPTRRLPPFFSSGLPILTVAFFIMSIGAFFFSKEKFDVYVSLIMAALIPVFGLVTRLWQGYGRSARRRISEV